MDAVGDRRRERRAALAILAVAVLIAVWVGHRPRPEPLPIPPPPEQTAEDFTGALMAPVEVVELPPMAEAPAPSPPSPAPPPPLPPAPAPPPPAPQMAPAPPPPPVPQPQAAIPPPEPAVAPLKPTEIARVIPPPVIPLHPEPLQRPIEPPPVTPLKPEIAPPKPAIARPMPLVPERAEETKADVALPPPLKPTQPDEADLQTFRTARAEAKTIEPLKPEPLPKPAPPPVETVRPVEPPPPPAPEIKPLVPEPPKVQVAKAEPPPPPKPRAQPAAPSPPPSPPAAAPQPTITSGNVGEGRALLRILEQGSGPGIQIGWPGDAGARDRLYRVLVKCFGMRVGVLDAENRLYMAEGQPGEPSEFNTDRYSGFVRRPEGAMAADEQREVTRLRGFHKVAATASIRVFPRRVDAFLISGLRQAVGENYLGLKSIRAIYRVTGQRVTVDTIAADGHSLPGIIDLSAVSTGCSE